MPSVRLINLIRVGVGGERAPALLMNACSYGLKEICLRPLPSGWPVSLLTYVAQKHGVTG